MMYHNLAKKVLKHSDVELAYICDLSASNESHVGLLTSRENGPYA